MTLFLYILYIFADDLKSITNSPTRGTRSSTKTTTSNNNQETVTSKQQIVSIKEDNTTDNMVRVSSGVMHCDAYFCVLLHVSQVCEALKLPRLLACSSFIRMIKRSTISYPLWVLSTEDSMMGYAMRLKVMYHVSFLSLSFARLPFARQQQTNH